jgi:hypothetical protein
MRRLLVLVVAILSGLAAQDPRPAPPNVLLIVADDQGYADLGCAGLADDVRTPHLDRLAQSGVRFTTAYATSLPDIPIVCASSPSATARGAPGQGSRASR